MSYMYLKEILVKNTEGQMFRREHGTTIRARFCLWAVVAALLISGCGMQPIALDDQTRGTNPVVATAPPVDGEDYSAAVAWQGMPEADAATEIHVRLLPSEQTYTISGVVSPVDAPRPVQLVRAGDRYFLAWIDNREPPAELRWRLLSASDLSPIGEEGVYEPVGNFNYETVDYHVSEFAAAYSRDPDHNFVVVVVLVRPPEALGEAEYRECVIGEISKCHLKYFTVNAENGVKGEETGTYFGPSQALSAAAGNDGFMIAVATHMTHGQSDTPDYGNTVRILALHPDAGEVSGMSYGEKVITGMSDCADDPRSIVDGGDELFAPGAAVASDESNYSRTAIAYNPQSGRYLVGYETACNNSYVRARWVKRNATVFEIYGVSGSSVTQPPFEIMSGIYGNSWSGTTKPMLTYNSAWNFYVAGFSSPYTGHVDPAELPDRVVFNRNEIWSRAEADPERQGSIIYSEELFKSCFPARISQDSFEPEGRTFSDFINGSLVADTEGDQRKTYYAWAQDDIFVPCVTDEQPYCSASNLDFSRAERSGPKLLFVYEQEPPRVQSCDDIFRIPPTDFPPDPDSPLLGHY